MKWTYKGENRGQAAYELWDNDEKLLGLSFHATSGTIRISADDERRVFLVERKGFLRTRVILRNEYGIRLGQLSRESGPENHGTIEIYEQLYHFANKGKSPTQVYLYKNNDVINVCELPAKQPDELSLILCWYLVTAPVKKHAEFA